MPFGQLFCFFPSSFGPVFPPKALLFSKTFFSLLRLSIADAVELVQEHGDCAKESLRSVDKEVK